ncbi:MAG: PRC-barrel domain-containing protein, partial [Nitrososphaerales archaeon]
MNGGVIGVVKNVMFDEGAWRVGSFDVQLNEEVAKEFEMKKVFRNYRFPLDVNLVQGIGDKITLRTSKEELMTLLATLEEASDTQSTKG